MVSADVWAINVFKIVIAAAESIIPTMFLNHTYGVPKRN